MIKIFLLALLFFPTLSFSQDTTINNTGSKISPEDAGAILDHHNKIRNDLKIPPLTWSAELAAYAQAWADSLASGDCTLRHREQPLYGENIYMASGSDSFKPVSASLAWYSEKEKYAYSKIGEGDWQSSLHYTQMIWKNTKEMGAGMATCPNGNIIIVANYNPSGNYSGEYPY
jgi:pathogenesis-related protein 1